MMMTAISRKRSQDGIALERASHLFGRSPNDRGYLIDDVDSPCVSIAVMIHAVGLLSPNVDHL